MKACIECKHLSTVNMIDNQPRCARFGKYTERFDLVYGTIRNLAAPDCRVARAQDGQCGPHARSFESKYGVAQPPHNEPPGPWPFPPEPVAPKNWKRWFNWLHA